MGLREGMKARGKGGVTSTHEPHRLKPPRQNGFQGYSHLQTLLCGLIVAHARVPEQALQVSVCQPFESAWLRMVTSRRVVVCLLVSRFRAVMSCRVTSPAQGQVTSRPVPSPLVCLFAPSPVLRSHQTMPCHLILSSLLETYLLSSHLPFSDLLSPPHPPRTFSPIFSISSHLGAVLPEILRKSMGPRSPWSSCTPCLEE